ncbi:hypothetical protein EUGRSUZ_F00614 [Eucalyptus grandis]|uniref:Uncharacterized protein n=2 Tax=Eucalyptus grandis TaxID=71139 RepID=A0ACC3KCK7_EUCGR|nr:hypothetical protein EUGRSUZ_F00614 [Eucalyptus grandis]
MQYQEQDIKHLKYVAIVYYKIIQILILGIIRTVLSPSKFDPRNQDSGDNKKDRWNEFLLHGQPPLA